MRTRVAQVDPALGAVSENANKLEQSIRRARRDDVELLVFPEMYLSGYDLSLADRDPTAIAAEAADELDRVARLTDDVTVIVGTPIADDSGVRNAAAVLDDGRWTDTYAKSHLYDAESEAFAPGDALPVIDTSAGRLGVMICYDVEFPEVARKLTLDGAEALISIWCQMRPFEDYMDAFLRARAMENVRPHVLCNRIGTEGDLEFHGASGIVSAAGAPLVTAGEDVEVEITADVDLDSGGHETLTYLDDRRPEMYE
ncbi:carbon-nitrogen hydrolase family protein [Haloplanus sp. GCM10025708]|uniref:carbon-nitrogen hydrolase family protein n=1 Tax=Haloferacaceae TaxID=1644056 RepID=UPI00360D6CED